MQIVREINGLDDPLSPWRTAGDRIALVPTMGALHAGHLALVARARELADRVVVSIFVNPLQFNDPADLERYPRDEQSDRDKLEGAGCDLVWLPTPAILYPAGFATKVSVGGVSERWEGEHRPGHFDGVATVVAKLLMSVRPDVAVFGEKDFQQLALIRRMVTDLRLGVEIAGLPTVRDADGLALSSRNALLSPDERQRALTLPQVMAQARDAIRNGGVVATTLQSARQRLLEGGFLSVDYLALVDSASLQPLDTPCGEMRLIAAATIGSTRLIDNLPV